MLNYYVGEEGLSMKTLLIIISILLIAIVLLQAGKAEGASSAMMGGNDALFKNRKERGGELFITRLTVVLGTLFFTLCLIMGF
jgi:preprotein translocase subunit SecG